jgi:DNA primase
MANFRSDIAQRIKASVTARDVLESYGFEVDRYGKCRCPFHSEKTASFQCYSGERGWYCFGCHEGGDVIKFVMKLEGLPFPAAVQELDSRLGLGLVGVESGRRNPEVTRRIQERKAHQQEYRRKEAEFAACVGDPCKRDRMEYLDYWLIEHEDWR